MIGKVISSLLKASDPLLALVDTGSIFPYVCNESTDLPFIVYTVDSVTPIYDKDDWSHDECIFSVETYCKNYGAMQDIALQVRAALEHEAGILYSVTIRNLRMTAQDEDAFELAFANKLTFEVEVMSYS